MLLLKIYILLFFLFTPMYSYKFPSKSQQHIRQNACIYVKMQIKLQYGKALYIVGNTKALGFWKVENAIRMRWNEDNIWRASFTLQQKMTIYYKYVIADYDNPQNSPMRWESGFNRKLSVSNRHQIYLHEKWNCMKVKLKLLTSRLNQTEEIYVVGNSVDLGLLSSPRYMRKQNNVKLEQNKQVWSITIFIQKEKEYIHYYYIMATNSEYLKERQPGRIFYFTQSKKYELINKIDRISVEYTPGEICISQEQSFKMFRISQITPKIYVGGYPKFQQEIFALENREIKSVLNLQSKEDMKRYGIDWKHIENLYKKHNIQVFNLQILDMKLYDFVRKSAKAVRIMNELISKHGSIYVHCTAGIYRSPQVVVLYLIIYQNYTIDNAIEQVRGKRPFAHPYLRSIQLSLKTIYQHSESERW